MRFLSKWRCRVSRISALIIPLVLAATGLAGCGGLFGSDFTFSPPASTTVSADQPVSSFDPSLNLQPAAGSAGRYVQVSGERWPPNMLVMVTLEDAQGRSETLAAVDTDHDGSLTTGFLYPIDQRWLASDSPLVVVTTADGRVETEVAFTVVGPDEAGEMASASLNVTATDTVSSGVETGLTEQEVLVLPSIAVAAAPAAAQDSGSASGASLGASDRQVRIEIEPGQASKSINCRNTQEWLTLAILGAADFDAQSVVPGSVKVAGSRLASADNQMDGPLDHLVGLTKRNTAANAVARLSERQLSQYQWQWRLADVNEDGFVDLVMQFRLGYIDLPCDAELVIVTGRTKDGTIFEAGDRVTMVGSNDLS